MAEFDAKGVTFEDRLEILATAVVVAIGKTETPGAANLPLPDPGLPDLNSKFFTVQSGSA
jgi:hypothetical protein